MFELNRLYNMDCMAAMQEIPDKFFELAICDPPYGIGIDGQKLNINKKNPKHTRKEHIRKNWDAAIPPEEYFRELERVSVKLAAGREIIPRCDAVMVGVRHGISAGMKAEIDFARRCGVPVQYIQE